MQNNNDYMYKVWNLAIALVFFSACNSGEHTQEERKDGFSDTAKTPEDSLFQQIMDGHDVGMAKLGKIKGSLGLAKAGLDSISKLKDSPEKKVLLQAFMDIQEDLNYADYSMNTWMTEFNPDSALDNKEARIRYLTDENSKIGKVKELILTTLQRADSLFKK